MATKLGIISLKVLHFICLLVSIFMASQHIIKYLENKDTSSVTFKAYKDENRDTYPSISLCFIVDPNHMFINWNLSLNVTSRELHAVLIGEPELVKNSTKIPHRS